jgi:multicomponent Na+:H+ antiporter subunit D
VSLGFATLAFALVGVPPAIGFAGKWQIVLGAVSAGHWAVGVVAVVSTMLTLAYFLRVVERLYFRSPSSVDEQTSDMSMNMTTDGGDTLVASSITTTTRIIVTLSAISAIGLGLAASDLITILEPAVEVYF